MTVEWWRFAQIADDAAGEGDAHRSGDDSRNGPSCATTSRAGETCTAAGSGDSRRSAAISKPPASRSSRSTSPRFAKGCRFAGSDWPEYLRLGRRRLPPGQRPACATRRRFTRTCATPSSTTSCDAIAGDGCGRNLASRARARRWSCSNAFAAHSYPNDIGPGVYDIHSPRVPSKEEMMR